MSRALSLLIALACVTPLAAESVDFEHTYCIPYARRGKALTHVPTVQFTPDGKQMLAGCSTGEVFLWQRNAQLPARRFRFRGGFVRGAAVDPGGRYLAVGYLNTLVAVDLATGRRLSSAGSQSVIGLAVHPKLPMVAVITPREITIRRMADLKKIGRFRSPSASYFNAASWSPDGKRLAMVGGTKLVRHRNDLIPSGTGFVEVRELAGGKAVLSRRLSQALYAVSYHPKVQRVAFGGRDRKLYQVDLASGKSFTLPVGQPYWITTMAYSPDGRTLAVGDESCDVWLRSLTRDGHHLRLLMHSKHHVECWLTQVAWTPDSSRVLFGCRSNTHAPRPSTYAPNLPAAISAAPAVRKTEQQIVDGRRAVMRKLHSDRVASAELAQLQQLAMQISGRLARLSVRWGREMVLPAHMRPPSKQVAVPEGMVREGLIPVPFVLAPFTRKSNRWNMTSTRPLEDYSRPGDMLTVLRLAPGAAQQEISARALQDADLKKLWDRLRVRADALGRSGGTRGEIERLEELGKARKQALLTSRKVVSSSFRINQYRLR